MGRPKGAKNKHSFQAEELAQKFDVQPLEILFWVANNDWKSLGYVSEGEICYTNAGIEYMKPHITVKDRVKAASTACEYLYSKKQSVTVTSDTNAFKIVVEDFTKK